MTTAAEENVATPEISNNTSVGLKDQLQVALAGAIGTTASVILWQARFGERGIAAVSFADSIEVLLLVGSVTLAWTRGVSHHPQQAWKFGFLAGAILSVAIDLVSWIFEIGDPLNHRIVILNSLRWGLCGFLGGLAIEKGWERRSAFRVALGVGIAGVIATFFEAFYADSFQEFWIFSDPNFWRHELRRQLLPAFGWALGIFLLPKSDDVLQRPHEDKDALPRNEVERIPGATEAGFKDQRETAVAATIGASAGLIFWYAIFEAGMLAWNLTTLVFLLSVGFSVWLSRYLDPFFGRLQGDGQIATESRPRLWRGSLRGVLAAIPVTIFTQLNDQLLTGKPEGMVLWLVAALGTGSITLAWARGLCRSPARAAEFGALTGVLVVGGSYLVLRTYAIMLNLRSVEESIAIVIEVALLWGLYGLLGGLAIERRRGIRLPLCVGLGVGVAGLIATGGVLFASVGAPNSENLSVWVKVLSKVLFVAVGWAWGITLWPRSDDVLRVWQERPERNEIQNNSPTTNDDAMDEERMRQQTFFRTDG
jgi:hypothetical protein